MKKYKDYMDNVSVDETLHEKIMNHSTQNSTRQHILTNNFRKYIPVAVCAAMILILITIIYPLKNINNIAPCEKDHTPRATNHDLPAAQATVNKEVVTGDACLREDAPVYRSISDLVKDSDYVLRGQVTAIEEVTGEAWQWLVFKSDQVFKAPADKVEFRVVWGGNISMASEVTPAVGEYYYLFAEAFENAFYPYRVLVPIYNQTLFPVGKSESLMIPAGVSEVLLPAVFAKEFTVDPEKAILADASALQAKAIQSVAKSYEDVQEYADHADMVLKVSFSDVEKMTPYAWLNEVALVEILSSRKASAKAPTMLIVNEALKTNTEYIIFLRLDEDGENYSLLAREGSILLAAESAGQEALKICRPQEG